MKKNLIRSLPAVLILLVPPVAWSQPEPVSGSYDTKNDWFVFQWTEPGHGNMTSILDPSNKVKPSINASVLSDSSSGLYTYSFKVSNLAGAVQMLQEIYISHPSAVSQASAPADWQSGEYRNKGVWGWVKTKGSIHGISAGQSVSGFSFKSTGIPGIVDAKFAGERREEFTTPGDDATADVAASFERIYANLKTQYPDKFGKQVALKTIGPVDPPAAFNAQSVIKNLITLVNQSRSQSWIDNDGIANSLLAKLNTALSKAVSDPKAAKNVLSAFLNDVQAQNGKHLSSESYALLYFNGKYLLDRL
ncbi:MAG: hypothetical protein ACJ763_06525 [Bdellovibrionia bacterium]